MTGPEGHLYINTLKSRDTCPANCVSRDTCPANCVSRDTCQANCAYYTDGRRGRRGDGRRGDQAKRLLHFGDFRPCVVQTVGGADEVGQDPCEK